MRALLVIDPKKRLSSEDMLKHPWFAGERLPAHALEPLSLTIHHDVRHAHRRTRSNLQAQQKLLDQKLARAGSASSSGSGGGGAAESAASAAVEDPSLDSIDEDDIEKYRERRKISQQMGRQSHSPSSRLSVGTRASANTGIGSFDDAAADGERDADASAAAAAAAATAPVPPTPKDK